MRVLALDFDGVICNSQREVFTTGLRTFAALVPDSTLLAGHPVVAAQGPLPDHRFDADPVFAAFEDLVPLGNRAEDFGVALQILEAGVEVPDQAAYDAFFAGMDPSWLEEYHRCFYRQRAMLREAVPEKWLALHRPYQRFAEILRANSHRARLAVATAKDGTSVRLLLARFGLDDLFPDELVLDKDVGVRKTAHLRELAGRLAAEPAQITFVDDKVNHLEKVAPLGVRPVLAGWGYNTPREHELARQLGLAIATLDNAEVILFG